MPEPYPKHMGGRESQRQPEHHSVPVTPGVPAFELDQLMMIEPFVSGLPPRVPNPKAPPTHKSAWEERP